MRDFLNNQLDYIYFFYGLSFLFLCIICFTLGKEKLQKFPWFFLGAFGLLHGFTEWTDMVMIIYGKNPILETLNALLLSISFLTLMEFARMAFLRLKGKTAPAVLYAPLIVFTTVFAFSLWRNYGFSGSSIAIRYFLGFPAAYFASRAIFEFSKKEPKKNVSLIVLSIILSLYAVSTGLIVPKAGFIPASLINFETFQETFIFPIQMLRGVLALSMAIALWFYSSTFYDIEYKLQKHFLHFIPTKWTITLILISLISMGWFLTNYFDYYAGIQIIKKAQPAADTQFNRRMKEISDLSKTSASLARSSAARNLLMLQNPQHIEKAKSLLEYYKTKFQALDCMLLDINGTPILSAQNAILAMGKEKLYLSTPYFKEALLGGNGYFVTLGKKYNERIYYVSYPIKNTENIILGVAVITKNIPVEPLLQYRLFSMILTLVIFLVVIIFFIAMRRREAAIALIERAHAQLEEIDRMKTDFVSIVSHELRTPLTSIRNAAGILLKGGTDKRAINEEEKELLDMIINNVDRQNKMIGDLLDVSKIESGVMPISIEPIELIQLIKEIIKTLSRLAEEKKITLDLSTSMIQKIVYADKEHTRRILSNLIVNAIKFTPEKGKITAKVEDFNKMVRVGIIDTGIGISNTDKKNLFNKFYRSSNPEAQHQSGFGLGLVITKGLVEAQGGEIWLESEINKGSIFYFTIPCQKAK